MAAVVTYALMSVTFNAYHKKTRVTAGNRRYSNQGESRRNSTRKPNVIPPIASVTASFIFLVWRFYVLLVLFSFTYSFRAWSSLIREYTRLTAAGSGTRVDEHYRRVPAVQR
jgi:hypothetical protein